VQLGPVTSGFLPLTPLEWKILMIRTKTLVPVRLYSGYSLADKLLYGYQTSPFPKLAAGEVQLPVQSYTK